MNKSNIFVGIVLITLGIYFMLLNANVMGDAWGSALPFLIGLAFLGTYFAGNSWALVPGAIVSSVGLSVIVAQMNVDMEVYWPIFVLAPGLGFWIVRIFGGQENKWAIFPATIITIVAAVMFSITLKIVSWKWLEYVGYAWPLILIALGLGILIKGRRKTDNTEL